jgi:hypothetical protein
MRIHRLTTTAGTVFAVAAMAASPAGALGQDLGATDARDAAAAAEPATLPQDLRSPDARDAAAAAEAATLPQDLRSPDARDAAERTVPVVVRVSAPPEAGFEWDSAAIGALGGTGLVLALAGGGVLVVRRRPRAARVA